MQICLIHVQNKGVITPIGFCRISKLQEEITEKHIQPPFETALFEIR